MSARMTSPPSWSIQRAHSWAVSSAPARRATTVHAATRRREATRDGIKSILPASGPASQAGARARRRSGDRLCESREPLVQVVDARAGDEPRRRGYAAGAVHRVQDRPLEVEVRPGVEAAVAHRADGLVER